MVHLVCAVDAAKFPDVAPTAFAAAVDAEPIVGVVALAAPLVEDVEARPVALELRLARSQQPSPVHGTRCLLLQSPRRTAKP